MEGPCAHPCPFMGHSDGVALWAQMSLGVLYWRESKQRNDPLKDFFPGMVWKCARPHVCTHLPESEHRLPGTLCSCYAVCIQGHTEQRGGVQSPPQHLAHRHLIKACFYEAVWVPGVYRALLSWGTRIPAAFMSACRMSCWSLQRNLTWRERHIRDFC